MDVLSQVLRSLRLRGSFYVAWNLNAPWGLSFESDHSAPFHYVESGEMWVVTNDGRSVHLEEGDFIVLFDGAAHRICDRAATVPERIKTVVARQARAGIDSHIHTYGGGGGRASRLVCGKFTIDERDSASASLQFPAMVHIRRDESARILAFARTLELLAEEARSSEPGAERSTALLTEVLYIQVLRVVLAQGDPMAAGWIEGLRDPNIAAALAAIHADPQKVWTLATLARIAGLSRSVFAERFHTRVGTPPMTYLASWRLQLAARWLRETSLPVSEILHRLAYGSAGAFHRAFKREHGLAPTAYRQKLRREEVADTPRVTRLHRSEDRPHAARHARRHPG